MSQACAPHPTPHDTLLNSKFGERGRGTGFLFRSFTHREMWFTLRAPRALLFPLWQGHCLLFKVSAHFFFDARCNLRRKSNFSVPRRPLLFRALFLRCDGFLDFTTRASSNTSFHIRTPTRKGNWYFVFLLLASSEKFGGTEIWFFSILLTMRLREKGRQRQWDYSFMR